MNSISTYAYELSGIEKSIKLLRSQLPERSSVLYSMKANPHPRVVEHAARQGVGLEVSSEGELEVAIIARDRVNSLIEIVCTGPGKSAKYLETAARAGAIVSIESITELMQMRELGITGQNILVRINAAATTQRAGLQMTGVPSQFGIDEEVADDAVRRVIEDGHNFRGVHLYMGSNITAEDDLVAQFEISTRIARRYQQFAGGPFIADLGGGFGHPFAEPGPAPRWDHLRDRLEVLTRELYESGAQITFESGRYIAGGCGTLRATVLDVKISKGQRFVVLSSGVNHLGGLTGLRRLPQARFGTNAFAPNPEIRERLVGPLCTPVDILNKSSSTALEVGDVVSVPNVGAYGLSASLANFLSHPYPTEEIYLQDRLIATTYTETTYKEEIPA